jgi:hypothetical protein
LFFDDSEQAIPTAKRRLSGLILVFYAKGALMDAGILPQARDLVLQLQFTALQFQHLQVIRRRMRKRFIDFVFERLVLFFEFRKMRLNCHVAFLLASDWLPDQKTVHQGRRNFDARLGCAPQQSPMSYHPTSAADLKFLMPLYRLESIGTNRDNFPGCGPLGGTGSAQRWH